jgi:hypothetical protein
MLSVLVDVATAASRGVRRHCHRQKSTSESKRHAKQNLSVSFRCGCVVPAQTRLSYFLFFRRFDISLGTLGANKKDRAENRKDRNPLHFLTRRVDASVPLTSSQSHITTTTSLNAPSTTMNILNSALLLVLSASATTAFAPTLTHQRGFASSALDAKKKVFIDGEAGTTGLQVRGRIEARDDLEIISAPDELRKDEATRKKLINEADAVILCKCRMC